MRSISTYQSLKLHTYIKNKLWSRDREKEKCPIERRWRTMPYIPATLLPIWRLKLLCACNQRPHPCCSCARTPLDKSPKFYEYALCLRSVYTRRSIHWNACEAHARFLFKNAQSCFHTSNASTPTPPNTTSTLHYAPYVWLRSTIFCNRHANVWIEDRCSHY